MTVYRMLGPKLAFTLVVLVLLARGSVSPRVHAQASTPQATALVDVATAWIYALKRSDVRMLDKLSDYPFESRLASAPCNCTSGKARDAAQLELLLSELMKSADVKALEVPSSDVKEISKAQLPAWATRWGKGVPKGARLMLMESSGGSVYTITYVLVVTENRVRAVWLDAATDGKR